MKSILLIITILACASSLFAQTQVCGTIDGETWTAAGSPYVVTCDLTVTSLDIEPGVTVLFTGYYQISISGYMNAVGTEADSIIFPKPDSVTSWGGILIDEVTTLQSQFKYCTIEHSSNSGLRIFDSVPPVMENCNFTNNSRSTGGGIYITNTTHLGSVFTVTNCEFSSNTSTGHGGAMTVGLDSGTLVIEGSTFSTNTANILNSNGNYVGGALYLTDGDAEISNTAFYSNRSNSRCSSTFDCGVTARGGAIYVSTGGNVEITKCLFDANRTNAQNAGNCFFGGYSRSYGAAVYVNMGFVTLSNCLLTNNITTRSSCGADDGGSGIYINGGSTDVINCTVVYNPDATGVERAGGSLIVENSIIFFNNGSGTQIDGSVSATYSSVQNGYAGEGNIADNPSFVDSDYHLSAVSLCVDAGNPAPEHNDRYFPPSLGGFRNDMGCYGGLGAYDPDLPLITIVDKPDDQGSWITLSWAGFAEDDAGAAEPITGYQVQRASDPFDASSVMWTTLFEVPATTSESYTTDVETDSTYVVDEIWPFYAYRIVGVTDPPGTEFISNTNIGMAEDNIAPPVPVIVKFESLGSRMIYMQALNLAEAPDFVKACIFRGGLLWQDRFPHEAVLWDEAVDDMSNPKDPCTSSDSGEFWYESHLNLFYYIAKSQDWHGNWSTASDSIFASYPTDADDTPSPIFELAQNYPNPFNPLTQIDFNLPYKSPVKLTIYDVSGRLVKLLIDDIRPAGTYNVFWNGRDKKDEIVASGLYFYKLEAGSFRKTKKMVLLK